MHHFTDLEAGGDILAIVEPSKAPFFSNSVSRRRHILSLISLIKRHFFYNFGTPRLQLTFY